MVDFWRKKVNSKKIITFSKKKSYLSWVFTFYKKNLVEKKNIYIYIYAQNFFSLKICFEYLS